MKNFSRFIVLAVLLILPTILNAQTKEEMDAWMASMTPGPVHEMFAKSDGKWTEEVKYWMDPNGEPVTTVGTAENKMILGGRYQYSTHSSTMMGMPFEGISVVGYDNVRKVIQSTWIDNMGTSIMFLEGKWDDASRSCTLTGKATDPMKGGQVDVREVFTVIDDNNHKMEMYMTLDGKEIKTMEILWKR